LAIRAARDLRDLQQLGLEDKELTSMTFVSDKSHR